MPGLQAPIRTNTAPSFQESRQLFVPFHARNVPPISQRALRAFLIQPAKPRAPWPLQDVRVVAPLVDAPNEPLPGDAADNRVLDAPAERLGKLTTLNDPERAVVEGGDARRKWLRDAQRVVHRRDMFIGAAEVILPFRPALRPQRSSQEGRQRFGTGQLPECGPEPLRIR